MLADAEELASLGSWEYDLEAGTILQSANLRRMLGSEPKITSITPESLWQLVDPEDHEMVRQIIERATHTREPYEYQARYILPDGRRRILLVRGKPVVDAANRVVKRIGVAMDVTERVEFMDAIRESAEIYRDLVENSHSLICTHDLSGQLLSLNELLFHVDEYFAQQGLKLPDPPFIDKVPVRFSVFDTQQHYHVPMLATPWSCTTYRGS